MSKIKKEDMDKIGDSEIMKTEKTFGGNSPQVYKKLELLAFPIYLSMQ